ncbi:MAG: hypothetical protein IPF61_06230 [Xanthomonadales bacterium]|nr:hypothetical protein [Xanthomonadales bacterium]
MPAVLAILRFFAWCCSVGIFVVFIAWCFLAFLGKVFGSGFLLVLAALVIPRLWVALGGPEQDVADESKRAKAAKAANKSTE